jgi:8-oxo-dGTP diphosphatase
MPSYCINCRSPKLQELVEENQVYYYCQSCRTKSGRSFMVDGKIRIIDTSRGVKHIVASALIIRDGKVLLTLRRTYPFGLEFPVGHVEYGESIEEALEREVLEELGVKVTSATLLLQIEQPVSYCRFGSTIEEWAVFSVDYNGQSIIENDEIESVRWVSLHDLPIKELTPNTIVVLRELGYLSRLVPKKDGKKATHGK